MRNARRLATEEGSASGLCGTNPRRRKAKAKIKKPQSWRAFIKGKMGKYMRSEGSHGAAMRRLSREWKRKKSR